MQGYKPKSPCDQQNMITMVSPSVPSNSNRQFNSSKKTSNIANKPVKRLGSNGSTTAKTITTRRLSVGVTALKLVPIQGEKKLLKTRNGVQETSVISKYTRNDQSTNINTNSIETSLPAKKPVFLIPIVFVAQPNSSSVSFSIISQSHIQNQTILNAVSDQTLAAMLEEISLKKEKPEIKQETNKQKESRVNNSYYFDDLDIAYDYELVKKESMPVRSSFLEFLESQANNKPVESSVNCGLMLEGGNQSMTANSHGNSCQEQSEHPFIEPSTIEILDTIINSNSDNCYNQHTQLSDPSMSGSSSQSNSNLHLVDYLSNLLQ